jgi:hypothetical protein
MNLQNPVNGPQIKPGFSTPENYFEGVEDKVFARLEKGKTKVVPLFSYRRRIWYTAAAILILALFLPVYNTFSKPEEIDSATLENYIAYQTNVNQYDLISLLSPQEIENLKQDMPIEDDAIEDILSENNNLDQIITE